MPTGKAPNFGWVGWPKRAPKEFGAVAIASLKKWRKPSTPEPLIKQIEQWKIQITTILARYFGSLSTPMLTETQRAKALKRGRRALRNGDVAELQKLDVNTRAIVYREQSGTANLKMKRWPAPLLVDPIRELAVIWSKATGRSPRTIDRIEKENKRDRMGGSGEYPFYEFIVDLFEAWGEKPPPRGSVIDILAQHKPKKSGDYRSRPR
jgi:hypothetical protein